LLDKLRAELANAANELTQSEAAATDKQTLLDEREAVLQARQLRLDEEIAKLEGQRQQAQEQHLRLQDDIDALAQAVYENPEATVFAAAVLMNERKIGSLMVMADGRLVGILTERDIMRRVVADQRDANLTLVSEVMTCDVVCCRPHTDLEEAKSVMKHRRIR